MAGHKTSVCGQHQTGGAVPLEKKCGTCWVGSWLDSELMWTFWRRYKFLVPPGIVNRPAHGLVTIPTAFSRLNSGVALGMLGNAVRQGRGKFSTSAVRTGSTPTMLPLSRSSCYSFLIALLGISSKSPQNVKLYCLTQLACHLPECRFLFSVWLLTPWTQAAQH